MERNYFVNQTEMMIRREQTIPGLSKIYKYVLSSRQQSDNIEYLLNLIKEREGVIMGIPQFREVDGEQVLLDENCHVFVATTKFSAFLKKLELRMRGYSVDITSSGSFYRIRKKQPKLQSINDHQAIS